MSAPLAEWAATADAVRATTKKNEKLRHLAGYLGGLDDPDLAIAARFFAGTPFPRTDERTLGLGWAALAEAMRERTAASETEILAAWRRHADGGDAAADLLSGKPRDGEPLSLLDAAGGFDAIAGSVGAAAKRAVFRDLLRRAEAAEARYLMKLVSGETRIGLRETLLEEAIARAFEREREAVSRANMLGGDIGEAAIRAKRGALDAARLAHFAVVGFMLATPVLDLGDIEKRFAPPYLVEDKYDGVRAQVHKLGDRVELYSRTADRVSERFPEVLPALRAIPGSFILDAELLSFAGGERAVPFTRFQTRLGRKLVPEDVRAALPATLVLFDILERDGRALLDRPLIERQEILRAMPLEEPLRLVRQERIDATGEDLEHAVDAAFEASRARGNEGLVVKDSRSLYKPGRRGMDWLKVKRPLRTLDVVVTAVEWGHGKRRGVLSDYTFAVREGDRLLNVGKAYSGLTDKEIAEMTEHFLARTIKDLGHARLVEPVTVIEIAFDQIQKSARHASGYALRFPRIARLRPDKPVSDIDTLDTVRSIAEGLL